ncbi:MAG: methyltransferase domain-containing protein [Candidatus Methylomirabilales bacterium]
MDKTQQLRDAVRRAYSAAAESPQDEHPFPVGRHFAESVGYPQDLLAGLPSFSIDAFSGCSNVSVFADIPVGVAVLDLGCGAGLDSLIAARRTGARGKVIGVDFSDAMLARAGQAAEQVGVKNVGFCEADAENLPIGNGMIDVALVNGIFNLNPKRQAIFRELARVVREGGTVYAAELILRGPLPPEIQQSEANWFA